MEFTFRNMQPDPGQIEDISYLYQHKILPGMSALFDRLTNEHTWMRIDALKLDLGILAYDTLEQDWYNKLLELVEKEIGEQDDQMSQQVAFSESILFYLQNGFFLGVRLGKNKMATSFQMLLLMNI